MFKLEGGWVGQDQFEHCSNLEIRTEKWMLPNSKYTISFLTKKLRNVSPVNDKVDNSIT